MIDVLLAEKAIELAENAGACMYANGDATKPQCVAGQYLHLRGVTVERLAELDKAPCTIDIVANVHEDIRSLLDDEEVGQLEVLQAIWDTEDDENDLREEMRVRLGQLTVDPAR